MLTRHKLMLAGALAASLAANTQAGLIHRYGFDYAGFKDSVGTANATGYNGAIANTAILDSSGTQIGIGVILTNYDSTNFAFTNFVSSNTNGTYIALPPTAITNTKTLTIESWFNNGNSAGANEGSSTNWPRIFDFGNNTQTSGQGYNFIAFTPYGTPDSPGAKLQFNIAGNDVVISNSGTFLTGYHHVAAVFDSSNSLFQLYLDGAFVSQTNTTNQVSDIGTNVLWLGRSEWSGNTYLDGAIDEFRIYDRALSAVEIESSYLGGTNYKSKQIDNLGALTAVNISGPSTIVEQYSSNVVATADFANATGLNLLNNPSFTFSSSDTNIATVDQKGVIKTVRPGTVNIIATYSNTPATLALTVTADTTAPTLVTTDNKFYNDVVELTFSKGLSNATAVAKGNYVIDGGLITISNIVVVSNTSSVAVVRLYTSVFDTTTNHEIVINGIKDTDATPNSLAANTTATFGAVAGAPLSLRIYFATDGYTVSAITNGMTNAAYPYTFGRLKSLTTGLTDNTNGDNYVSVTSGWLLPPSDGDYYFSIASDDEGAFYLSSDATTNGLPKYANIYQSGYIGQKNFVACTNGAWHLQDGTTTTNWSGWKTNLNSTNKYYFRYLHHNGTGGDLADVAWAIPGDTLSNGHTNIEAQYIFPEVAANVTLSITNQPTNATGLQGRPIILTSGAYGVPTYTAAQWYKDGKPATNIVATNAIVTIAKAALTDSGTYYAVFSNLVTSVTSSSMTLTVAPDTNPPTIYSVTTTLGYAVIVAYNEQVDTTSATALTNYVLTNRNGSAIIVTNATIDASLSNVTLYVSNRITTNFAATVSGVLDLASNKINKITVTGYYYGAAYGMISYWPLDTNIGFTTPDVVSSYDFQLYGMTTNSSGAVTNLVPGVKGNAFYFNGTSSGYYLASSNDAIPVISKQKNFTISLWVKADGTAQNDCRFFYEGYNSTLGGSANQPFWSFQTLSSAHVYTYIRQDNGTVRWFKPASTASPLDGAAWHHILWTETTSTDGTNTVTANCYIDGVRDTGMEGSATNGISATVESIGSFWRQSIGGGTKCYIDEVALWNRALTADEIQLVYTNGVPTPVILPLTLAIKYFTAQLPAVAAGTPVTLNWSVSKDATQVTITPDIGDVTALTTAGLGSVTFTPTTTKTYTLTLTRGIESVTQTLKIPVVASVAAGWELIDNFDRYTAGATLPSPWITYIDGTFNVVNYNGNNLVSAGGSAIQGLDLGAFSIPETQVGTLFFRFVATNAAAQSNDAFYVGLSDLTPRYAGEAWGTIGDGVSIENPVDVPVFATKDGFFLSDGTTTNTTYTNASYTFANGQVYNVWIDITNDTVANLDKYDVYVAADGSARTQVFSQIRSDRNPVDTSIYGPVQTGLLRVFLDSQNGSGSTLLIDDLYLSFGSFRSTVPAPFGFTPLVGGAKPSLTAVISGGNLTISWDANNGAGYTLVSSATVDGTYSAVSTTPTTANGVTSVTVPASSTAQFYRLKQ